jgi:hypothetical protein
MQPSLRNQLTSLSSGTKGTILCLPMETLRRNGSTTTATGDVARTTIRPADRRCS